MTDDVAVRLARFAQHVLNGHFMDAVDLQELAVKHGLLVSVRVTEPCVVGCQCDEYGNIPGICYRLIPEVRDA